jgi:hypothetical protein
MDRRNAEAGRVPLTLGGSLPMRFHTVDRANQSGPPAATLPKLTLPDWTQPQPPRHQGQRGHNLCWFAHRRHSGNLHFTRQDPSRAELC